MLDISPVMIKVVDAAVTKALAARRKLLEWRFIQAGRRRKMYEAIGFLRKHEWIRPCRSQGPTTPVKAVSNLNVPAPKLDVYTCLRPVRWFEGVPHIKSPGDTNMVIFRENSEDISRVSVPSR